MEFLISAVLSNANLLTHAVLLNARYLGRQHFFADASGDWIKYSALDKNAASDDNGDLLACDSFGFCGR